MELTPEQVAILALLDRIESLERTTRAQATAIRGLKLALAAREASADGPTVRSSTGAPSSR
jgi:hypothetical protein